MNKRIIVYILAVFTFLGCKKIDKLTQFNIEFNNTATIPSSTGINLPFNVLTPDVETNSSSTFSSNDTRKDLIEEILLKELRLTINTPNGEDFSFLKSISIYINANGLSEAKIAYNDNVSQNVGSTLALTVLCTDLK